MRSNRLVEYTHDYGKYWEILETLPYVYNRLLARKRLKLRKLLEELDEHAKTLA